MQNWYHFTGFFLSAGKLFLLFLSPPSVSYYYLYTESKHDGRFQYAQAVALNKNTAFASSCIKCGKCEAHCPQSLPIREKLQEADKALRPLPYKIGINVVRAYMFRK